MSTFWLVTQAILLELTSLYTLSSELSPWAKTITFLISHSAASALFTLLLWRTLPSRYRKPRSTTFLFLFLIQVLLPYLGLLGLIFSLLLALRIPRRRRGQPWHDTEEPELPFKSINFSDYPIYSSGGLLQILRDSPDPGKRLEVVLSLKQMPSKEAIKLLNFALKDPVDDVRLLAYSMLDEKEKSISENIKSDLAKIKSQSGSRKKLDDDKVAKLHQRIASNYWELVYLDLVHGGVRQHIINQAEHHIEQSLQLKETPDALKLYGKLLIQQEKLPKARFVFEKAIFSGLAPASISPYLAEVAFLSRNFSQVPGYLRLSAQEEQKRHNLIPIFKYWLQ